MKILVFFSRHATSGKSNIQNYGLLSLSGGEVKVHPGAVSAKAERLSIAFDEDSEGLSFKVIFHFLILISGLEQRVLDARRAAIDGPKA
jgi:hypothetical protein